MHLKINIVLILLALILDVMDGSPVCGTNACQKIKCLPVEQIRKECLLKKGIINEKSGWCSCCVTCMKRLYEDQNCEVTLSPQLPLRAQCSEGLICNPQIKRCVKNSVQ